jgi:hypothetical protein
VDYHQGHARTLFPVEAKAFAAEEAPLSSHVLSVSVFVTLIGRHSGYQHIKTNGRCFSGLLRWINSGWWLVDCF